ncbi:MAG: BatE, domain containing protein [Pedosphaera sp.]|nr:BatE, domain containing protein [Pedosphaera sp.]
MTMEWHKFKFARRSQQLLPALLFLLFLAAPLRAVEFEARFEQANKFYEEGKYDSAAGAYDKLLEAGPVSGAVYFNRGNALFKMGQLGRAIASYRQGEQLLPRDPDLRANLQFARTQARGGSPYQRDYWQRWLHLMTLNEWTLLTAGLAWLFFILLALTQWRPESTRGLRPWLAGIGGLLVVLGVTLAGALNRDYFTTYAIIIAGEADVRNGPLDESQTSYKVRDGMELTVHDRKDGWLQVLDSAQRSGWLRQDQMLLFEPAAARKPKS